MKNYDSQTILGFMFIIFLVFLTTQNYRSKSSNYLYLKSTSKFFAISSKTTKTSFNLMSSFSSTIHLNSLFNCCSILIGRMRHHFYGVFPAIQKERRKCVFTEKKKCWRDVEALINIIRMCGVCGALTGKWTEIDSAGKCFSHVSAFLSLFSDASWKQQRSPRSRTSFFAHSSVHRSFSGDKLRIWNGKAMEIERRQSERKQF